MQSLLLASCSPRLIQAQRGGSCGRARRQNRRQQEKKINLGIVPHYHIHIKDAPYIGRPRQLDRRTQAVGPRLLTVAVLTDLLLCFIPQTYQPKLDPGTYTSI